MEELINKELLDLIKAHYIESTKDMEIAATFEESRAKHPESFEVYLKIIKRSFNLGVQKSHDAAGSHNWSAQQRIKELKIKE